MDPLPPHLQAVSSSTGVIGGVGITVDEHGRSSKVFCCTFRDCVKSFKRYEHLKRHNLMHTGERPYACQICEKRFSRSDNLSQHIKIHSREHREEQNAAKRRRYSRRHIEIPDPESVELGTSSEEDDVDDDDDVSERVPHSMMSAGADDDQDDDPNTSSFLEQDNDDDMALITLSHSAQIDGDDDVSMATSRGDDGIVYYHAQQQQQLQQAHAQQQAQAQWQQQHEHMVEGHVAGMQENSDMASAIPFFMEQQQFMQQSTGQHHARGHFAFVD